MVFFGGVDTVLMHLLSIAGLEAWCWPIIGAVASLLLWRFLFYTLPERMRPRFLRRRPRKNPAKFVVCVAVLGSG